MSKRASYREAVALIAINDEPRDRDLESIAGYTTTVIIADLFGKTAETVAADILRAREKETK